MIAPDLLEQIEHLPLDQRLALLEFLSRGIREELKEAGVIRVRGLLATDQPAPNDEEVKDAYADYLDEKYR